MNDFYEGDPRKPVDLTIGTEREVYVSETEKKKVRVEEEQIRGSCHGCMFEMKEEGTCLQDSSMFSKQPEYECSVLYRADKKSVIFVEVKE